MAANLSLLQLPSAPTHSLQSRIRAKKLKPTTTTFTYSTRPNGSSRYPTITCSYSNGQSPDSVDDGVKKVKRILEEKKRAELSARIASGEFTVEQSGFLSVLRNGLSKLGVPTELLDFLSKWNNVSEGQPKIPEAKGAMKAIGGQAFFIPLYELYLTYGGIFRLTFGPKSFLIVSDPSIAKHILRENSKAYSKGILAEILDFVMGKGLIPADGEIWRVRRRAIVPALHQKYVTAMISLFGQATERLCKKLDAAASDGEDVEMESFFSRLTLDIIGKAVFNYDFDSLTNDTGIVEAVYTVLREAEDRSVAPIPFWEIPIWKDISPRQRKVSAALKLINDTLDDLIAICKRMVEQEELQFHEEYMNEQDPSILHFLLASGDDVSSKQLRDDLMTMLIAGHETSAAVLTWTFYLLSTEPSVMSKLQNEVDSVLGDRFPTIDDMKKLKYATRVINESLRLYPQPPVLIRRSLEDDMLGEYPIKRGEDIFISVWNLHRCPDHWVEADKFNPERWPLDGPNPNEINQDFSYLPFGGGPRKCVGDMFASFETVVALSMLVRRFNFQIAIGAPPVEMTTGATIHTTEGLKMTVTRRTKPPIIPTLVTSVVKGDDSSPLKEPSPTMASSSMGILEAGLKEERKEGRWSISSHPKREKNKQNTRKTAMKIDKEMPHPSHPQHRLQLEYTEIPFNCDGCKEAGIGLKYRCQQCEFDLHKACAQAPQLMVHPFYKKCEFRLYHRPPGTLTRICDACRNDVVGFVYHCEGCGFDLHPCCANLPQVLDDGERNLCLSLKLSSSCHRCGGKGPGWSYRSECKNYNLHVSCVKELLKESWQAMYLNADKNRVREMQTRIPSLRGTLQNHHSRGKVGKVQKCCQIAAGAVRIIASAILGDPTAIIAAVVGGFISK